MESQDVVCCLSQSGTSYEGRFTAPRARTRL